MNEANTKSFKNPKTIQIFNRYATYNGSNPYKAPATLNVIPHLEFGYGTFLPQNGMYEITSALYKLALKQGIKFSFNSTVDSIEINDKKARGIKVNNQQIDGDIIVSNMDIYPTYKKLLSNTPTPRRIEKIEPSSSALIFYWAIKKEFKTLDLHNVFFSNDYKDEFTEIFENKKVSTDPTIYVNITSKYVKNDAPLGCENWFVMINVPYNLGEDMEALRIICRKNILDKLNRILKTNIEEYIEHEDYLDPNLIEIRTSSYRGSIYGSSSNKRLSAFVRHPNFKKDIENLYFCGGSVHPGGGIPLCLLSASIISSMIKK